MSSSWGNIGKPTMSKVYVKKKNLVVWYLSLLTKRCHYETEIPRNIQYKRQNIFNIQFEPYWITRFLMKNIQISNQWRSFLEVFGTLLVWLRKCKEEVGDSQRCSFGKFHGWNHVHYNFFNWENNLQKLI